MESTITSARESAVAPDFVVVDTRGNEVRLSAFRGQKDVVLVFTRGFY